MPTWTKRINISNTKKSGMSLMESTSSPTMGSTSKYSSFLPEIYTGQAQRIERYRQYNEMDLDSEISTSLDTIADFSTQPNQNSDVPFELNFDESEMTTEEIELLNSALKQWCRINKFKKRIWKIFRNVIKFGDFILIRDPETFRLYDVAPDKVEKVIVNEAEGKEPYYYVIQGLDLNLQAFAATKPEENIPVSISASTPRGVGTVSSPMNMQTSGNVQSMKNTNTLGWYVNASDTVHLSLSDEMDYNWPFGNSILETVFKTYKQKQLLEDAILIYRIQRAPERRIFKIDVGDNPPHIAQSIVERAKNEVHQKRIPSRTGGGNNILDASYNPLSILEDYFFAVTPEGRGSSVETLPGGENLGQIDDLRYFDNKLKRGLGVPSSYLPSGPDDGTTAYNDGRVGTAYMQEYRFSRFCKRLQLLVIDELDREFKMFLKKREIAIDSSTFNLEFPEPQNFSKFRQMAIDGEAINMFSSMKDTPYLSKRFMLERYLGLDDADIMRNEKLWLEENEDLAEEQGAVVDDEESDLSGVGMRPSGGGDIGFDADVSDFAPDMGGDESPISGGETDTEEPPE